MGLTTRLSELIETQFRLRSRVLVGIDGPDASGKTRFADGLAAALDMPVIRASVDGFHNPRSVRRQRGDESAEGFYLDAFNYESLASQLLVPFAAGQSFVETQIYDYQREALDSQYATEIPEGAVLIVDGVFVLRAEIRDHWDLMVYLDVSPDETLRRAMVRDVGVIGSDVEVERRYRTRYLPGQALYAAETEPQRRAHVVLDNTHPRVPLVLKWAPPTG